MAERTIYRLGDIVDAIDAIRSLLDGTSFEQMVADPVVKAAFERFLEILSEASRHIPEALKRQAPQIPWRRIGDIGNHYATPTTGSTPRFYGLCLRMATLPHCARLPWTCRRSSESVRRSRF